MVTASRDAAPQEGLGRAPQDNCEQTVRLSLLHRLGVTVLAVAAAKASLWPLWTSAPVVAVTTLCVPLAFVLAASSSSPSAGPARSDCSSFSLTTCARVVPGRV